MPIASESGWLVPAYGEAPTKPGLYLALLHGRFSPRQEMNEWGFNGPLIGPIDWCHTTYATQIRISFTSEEDEQVYFPNPAFPDAQDIRIVDDLLVYEDCYYGDWSVFVVHPHEVANPKDTFRAAERRNYFPKQMHVRDKTDPA